MTSVLNFLNKKNKFSGKDIKIYKKKEILFNFIK